MDIELLNKTYKFIIIDTSTRECVLLHSYNEIEDFIKNVCEESISHNTIGRRIKEDNHFIFEHLIIKKLIWT